MSTPLRRVWRTVPKATLAVGLAAVVCGGLAPATASGVSQSLYVSGKTGSDTLAGGAANDCLVAATPCATITHALGQASAGDLIDVLDIPATESLTIDKDVDFHLPGVADKALPDDITIDAGSTLTVEGDPGSGLSGHLTGGGGLIADGTDSSLTLSGMNTYTGATVVKAGVVTVGKAGALPPGSALTVDSGAYLDLNGQQSEVASLDGSGAVDSSSGPVQLTVDAAGISAFNGSMAQSVTVVMANGPSLLVESQPSNEEAPSGGTVTFTVRSSAGPGSTVSWQWQTSADGGASWSDVSGANASSFTVSGVTPAQSGTHYRAAATLAATPGATPYVTNPAGLYLTAAGASLQAGAPVVSAPGPTQSPGTYSLGLSFVPGDILTATFQDKTTGATYEVDASGATDSPLAAVTGYVVNPATFSPPAPGGATYVVGFAVSFALVSGAPGSALPFGSLSLTVTDPSIQAGEPVYKVTAGPPVTLTQVGTATAGKFTVSFSDDPVFLVGQAVPVYVPPPSAATTTTTPRAPVRLIRLGGPDRIGTAIAISGYDFTRAGSAQAVVLGRDDLFPDDMAGAPLAKAVGGPLLLTGPTGLDTRTAAEMTRVLPTGGTVYLLGDTSALSDQVAKDVAALGYRATRVGGPDRYTTAARVADAMGDPATVFEADGTVAGGVVSAASAAIASNGAVLFTDGSVQSPPTGTYLSVHQPASRFAIGSSAVSADPEAAGIAGPDDDSTAVAVAQRFFPDPTVVGIATDGKFPDALTGASTSESGAGPTLLVPTDGPLPAGVAAYLQAHPSITTIFVYGGIAAVSDAVAQAVLQATTG
ncbi:MAG TPA: cell wall-binding repeat-containing protein [Acidimicrobiales bacterium]|nr:cell wall-binding repeat-containing protein [Acidimicrobiales bacterium]